jgi:hypothetical protein
LRHNMVKKSQERRRTSKAKKAAVTYCIIDGFQDEISMDRALAQD